MWSGLELPGHGEGTAVVSAEGCVTSHVEGAMKAPGELYSWVLFSALPRIMVATAPWLLSPQGRELQPSQTRKEEHLKIPMSCRCHLKKFSLIFCICNEYVYMIQNLESQEDNLVKSHLIPIPCHPNFLLRGKNLPIYMYFSSNILSI